MEDWIKIFCPIKFYFISRNLLICSRSVILVIVLVFFTLKVVSFNVMSVLFSLTRADWHFNRLLEIHGY